MAREPSPKRIEVDAVYFRYSNYDVPFWVRANTTDERWHRSGDGSTQYLSATADGAWAELIRNEDLRSDDELALVRMPLWQARITQGGIADYGSFERAEAAGLPPDALVDDDQERCRSEGERLRAAGFAGALYPSAALPGEVNLVLFGARIMLPWGSPRVLASGVPAAQVTVGAPPSELLPRVRLHGDSHAGLAEYRRVTASKRRR
jgi:hypothetical protein